MYRPNNIYRRRYGASKKEPIVAICAQFGCGKPLTLPEQLAGRKCIKCQTSEKPIFKHYNN